MTLPNLIISKRTYIKPEIFLEDILEEKGVLAGSPTDVDGVNPDTGTDSEGDSEAKGMKFGVDWSNWEE